MRRRRRTPEVFDAASLGRGSGAEQAALRAGCAALVARWRARDVRILGLVPAGDDVAIPPVAVAIGRALLEKHGGPVAIVDGDGSWTRAAALRTVIPPAGMAQASGSTPGELAFLAPPSPPPGLVLSQLRDTIRDASSFRHLVVDLTGFGHVGEHRAACELLDGVVLVARSGRTTFAQLERWLRELPEERGLGVLLTGV